MAWVNSETHPSNLPGFNAVIDPNPPPILFRVVPNYAPPNPQTGSWYNIRMTAVEPYLPPRRTAFDAHLSQTHQNTPFTLFTRSWEAVLREREYIISRHAANVAVIALRTAPELEFFDAYDIATKLGYADGGLDRKRQRGRFRDKWLMLGKTRYDSVVAVFRGHEAPNLLRFAWSGIERDVYVPGVYGALTRRIAAVLAWEIERNLGHFDPEDLVKLVNAMKI